MKKLSQPFDNHMSRGQLIFGLLYLPCHVFILPVVLPSMMVSLGVSDLGTINLVYYTISICAVLAVFWSHLRAHFDTLLDRVGWCLITFLMALGIDYLLSLGVSSIVLALSGGGENPNDSAIMEIAMDSEGAVKAVAIFMAPIVEEVLFRGAIFGGVRERSRVAAYALSMLIFALYHVWQYALVYADWTVLIYVLQYLPVSFALAWAYERSGSIWVPIGFHMMINSLSFYAQELLAEMA